jgi:hypothetical protein
MFLILRFNAEFSENPARMIKTGALPPGDIIVQGKNINGPGYICDFGTR